MRNRKLAAAVGAAALFVLPASATAASQRVCGTPARLHAACLAEVVTEAPGSAKPRVAATPSGYGAADLQGAYRLPATGGAGRTIAIVDAYDSTPYQGSSGWMVFGGTSASAPIVAGAFAQGGHSAPGTPYANTAALFDVTSGSNGACSVAYLCTAGAGYDGPTGLGTPNGAGAF